MDKQALKQAIKEKVGITPEMLKEMDPDNRDQMMKNLKVDNLEDLSDKTFYCYAANEAHVSVKTMQRWYMSPSERRAKSMPESIYRLLSIVVLGIDPDVEELG